ncbi:MAG: DNA polymerase IV [Kiloniellaceae bacterium]
MPGLCRDCLATFDDPKEGRAPPPRCPHCKSPRLVWHPDLHRLSLAHIDCDAFYASVEKRDRPELRDKPVIVGGGRRGVVSAACYVARMYGVHSAMPMFKALKACPDAVVIRPDMAKYSAVGRAIRERMLALTPLVEPLSIDEAFLDLSGTEALHHGWPARSLARFVKGIEDEMGLTASVGLSYCKFFAKVASDLDKPRGFAVLGFDAADSFLADKPVGIIWGVGKALRASLAKNGITLVRHLLPYSETELVARYGSIGHRLFHFARGEDERRVTPDSPAKSLSAETTFNHDIAAAPQLLDELWPLCEKVARRLKRAGLAGRSVQLKLKTADFRIVSRSRRLGAATQLAEELYRTAVPLVRQETDGRAFRLIGIGAAELVSAAEADLPDLLDPERAKRAKVERAIDQVRAKLGDQAIGKGRALPKTPTAGPPKKRDEKR